MRATLRYVACLAFAFATAAHANVRAWLDRDTMQMGETVTLNVESDASRDAPDFQVLGSDFDLLGTTSSSSVNIVNGATTSKQQWAVGLAPKHEGRLAIPALTVGSEHTQPLTLTVQAAPKGAAGGAGDELFLEVQLEPHTAYVQEQLRFTVKFYFAVALLDGSLDDPHAEGLTVQKLGQERQYQAERGGRRYQVVERHYALVAQQSGHVTLPPLTFRGHVPASNSPGGFFINRGRAVAARSEPIDIDIKPRPADAPPGPWLPAASLEYTAEGVDASTHARVGEPITLDVKLRAQGLAFEQLPELALPPLAGAEVYPDKAETATRDDGTWLLGERRRKFAIVPNQPGTLHLPALQITWWDTKNDRAATAEIPARDVQVEPAAGGRAPVAAAPNAAEARAASSAAPAPSVDGGTVVQSSFWRNVAFVFIAAWLVTAAALVLLWRRTLGGHTVAAQATGDAPRDDAQARRAWLAACRRGDAAAAARALLAWAAVQDLPSRNLGDLAAALADPRQRAALAAFERARYAGGDARGALAEVEAAFARGFIRPEAEAHVASVLPPLYPAATRRRA